MSPPICTAEEMARYAEEEHFGVFVVGSDQVWRKAYSPYMPDYFLAFLPPDSPVKRLAYAASFGVDRWDFDPEETARYADLAKRFDLITVREESGVELCRDHFGVEATHVLDPTMLVDRSVYERLALGPHAHESRGDLFVYILDRTPDKQQLADRVAREKGLTPFEILPKSYQELLYQGGKIDEAILPGVEQWLRSFVDAKYVVTDSFHGTVFSLLFDKSCLVIPNAERGGSRFDLFRNLLVAKEQIGNTVEYELSYSGRGDDRCGKMRERSIEILRSHL